MEKSESIVELSKALAVFHMKVAKIPKTDTNPFFKSKYAGLPSILDAIQVPLEESDLVFVQLPDGENLTTIIIHTETGQFFQSSYKMSAKGNDPQSVGSAITYARRYALGAILGLNIDEDDDGNKASKPDQPIVQNQQPDKPWLNLFNKDKTINEKVYKGLTDRFAEGASIDDIKQYVRINKDEEQYIITNILKY